MKAVSPEYKVLASTVGRWIVSDEPRTSVFDFVSQALTELPEGTKVRLIVETVEPEPESSQTPFIVSKERLKPAFAAGDRLVSERATGRVIGTIQKTKTGWFALNWYGTVIGSAERLTDAGWMVWNEGKSHQA